MYRKPVLEKVEPMRDAWKTYTCAIHYFVLCVAVAAAATAATDTRASCGS